MIRGSALVVARRNEEGLGHHRCVRWVRVHRGDESENASSYFSHFFLFCGLPPPSFPFFPFWGMGRIRFPFAAAAGDLVMEKIALRSACAPLLGSRMLFVPPPPLLRFCAVFALPKPPANRACLPRGARKE